MARPFKSEASRKAAEAKKATLTKVGKAPANRARSKPHRALADVISETTGKPVVSVNPGIIICEREAANKLNKLVAQLRTYDDQIKELQNKSNKLAIEHTQFLNKECTITGPGDAKEGHRALLLELDLTQVAVWTKPADFDVKPVEVKKRNRSNKKVAAPAVTAPEVASDATPVPVALATKPAKKRVRKPKAKAVVADAVA